MKQEDILNNAVPSEERSLNELQHWLQYAKHTWSLGAGIIWIPYSLIFLGLKIIAVVFAPYMLWHLYKAQWYKTIGVFLTVVVLPFLILQFVQVENQIAGFLFNLLPFLNFYIFTYTLSYIIGEELIKIETIKRWNRAEYSAESTMPTSR